jgi:hypothetical protein
MTAPGAAPLRRRARVPSVTAVGSKHTDRGRARSTAVIRGWALRVVDSSRKECECASAQATQVGPRPLDGPATTRRYIGGLQSGTGKDTGGSRDSSRETHGTHTGSNSAVAPVVASVVLTSTRGARAYTGTRITSGTGHPAPPVFLYRARSPLNACSGTRRYRTPGVPVRVSRLPRCLFTGTGSV